MALTWLSPLHRAARQIGLWFEERLPDLPGVEGHLISYLLPYGPCPVNELVRVFGIKHSTMTSILDRLEERGLVERKDNPEDKRSWLIALTRKGQNAAARVNALVAELEKKIDARVSERSLAGFQRVMEAIGEATEVEVRRR
ncbi:MAG TPA: MarR family transcriptional regulator [Thermoanaerobaculia bacterium]|nr:MarR family transcriptional regulator [Thermoanaerobaculia bacterium]